jgi:hypothetical protein
LRSEEFDNSYWAKNNVTVIPNAAIAPDGTLSADKIVQNNLFSTFKFIARSPVGTINGNHTLSVFLKAGESYRGYIQLIGPETNAATFFDLSRGIITNTSGTTIRTITPYPNGWYRLSCGLSFNNESAIFYIVMQANTGASSYTGDGTSGFYVWGAQVEQGSFPTSYIPTQASTRTRAADIASITGKNFSDFYNQSEGTIFSEAKGVANIFGGNTRRYWEISRGGSGNDRFLSGYNSSILVRLFVVKDGLTSASITETNQNPFNNSVKVATSFANNYYRLYSNNLYGNPVNSGILPIVDRIDLGGTSNNAGAPQLVLNGTISRLTYFPKRLPNSQLQALTS